MNSEALPFIQHDSKRKRLAKCCLRKFENFAKNNLLTKYERHHVDIIESF